MSSSIRCPASRCRPVRSCSITRARALTCLVPLLGGCAAEFDPGSELAGLRVLAVKKSAPYARPGSQVDLELLWSDTVPERAPPEIAWLAFCQNPPADLFESCFSQVPTAPDAAQLAQLAARASLPTAGAERANDHFSFQTSPDIIRSRPPPKDRTTVPYGLDYVLFAVCAGTLELRSDRPFPFVCYQEQDDEPGLSSGDVELGPSDFVVGYTAVFAYDELTNQNPLFSGVQWEGLELRPGESPSRAGEPMGGALAPEDLCIGGACPPAVAGLPPSVCHEALTLEACPDTDSCDQVELTPVLDPTSAEPDAAASALRANTLGEQMWVNFYASEGSVSEEVRLLNDAAEGWNPDPDTKYKPGKEPGVAYLWSVAHDNRGGVEWARLRICIR